jgi:hypothetical protein
MANPTTPISPTKSGGGAMSNEPKTRPHEHKPHEMNKPHDKSDEGLTDKAMEMASTAASKAKDMASSAVSTAGEVASAVGQKAEDATCAVGGGIKSLAGTIREKGPHGGFTGQATSTVADALETTGSYLEEQGLSGIGEDLTNLIRRNPIPALLVGIGLGFLLARATRS